MREATEFNFPNVQWLWDTFVGSLATSATEGNLLLQDHKDESLQQGRWKIVSLIDFILSKIHSATAHVISASVFVCGSARDEQRNSLVYFEMGRSSMTWRDDDVESNQFEVSSIASATWEL